MLGEQALHLRLLERELGRRCPFPEGDCKCPPEEVAPSECVCVGKPLPEAEDSRYIDFHGITTDEDNSFAGSTTRPFNIADSMKAWHDNG
jgi:hypothetical protein